MLWLLEIEKQKAASLRAFEAAGAAAAEKQEVRDEFLASKRRR